jgi:hypothetical protein
MPSDSELVQKDTERMVSQEAFRQRRKIQADYINLARKRLFYILINSTAIFIITYLLSYLICQLITMGCAYLFGIPSVLYYYEIVFGIPNNSPEWTHTRIGITYIAAPSFSLITGSILLFGIIKKYHLKQYHKLFLLWLGFHMFNFFFSGILAGSVTGLGIGYAMDIAFWYVYIIYGILSSLGILCLVLVGNDFTEHFLKTNPYNYWSKRKNRKQYLVFTLVFPWLIGSILMFLIKFPDHTPQHTGITIHDLIISLSMIFLVLPMFYRKKNARFHPKTNPAEKKRNIIWMLVILTILFVTCFRVGLTSFFYSLFI